MKVANPLAYSDTATVIAVKSFIVQALEQGPVDLSVPYRGKLECLSPKGTYNLV
jgi:hypothetical protein